MLDGVALAALPCERLQDILAADHDFCKLFVILFGCLVEVPVVFFLALDPVCSFRPFLGQSCR